MVHWTFCFNRGVKPLLTHHSISSLIDYLVVITGPCCEAWWWPLTCFHSQRSWPVYGVSGYLDHEAKREPEVRGWREETQVQKDKRRKRVSLATETNPQKRNLHSDPMRDVWLIASLRSNITECDLRLQPGLRLQLLKYNLPLTATNCNKWCYTVEYSSSTVSLLQKSIMNALKRHFCSCLLANTWSCRLCLCQTLSSCTTTITHLMFGTVMNKNWFVSDQTFTVYFLKNREI